MIARIHIQGPVQTLVFDLLSRIGKQHPQALISPLLVACKSQSTSRRQVAQQILDGMRNDFPTLVDQAELVGPLRLILTPNPRTSCPICVTSQAGPSSSPPKNLT